MQLLKKYKKTPARGTFCGRQIMRAVGVFGSMLKLTTTRLYFQYKRILTKKRKKIKRKRHKKNKEGEVSPSLQPALRSYATPSSGGNPRNAPNIKLTKKSPYEKIYKQNQKDQRLGRSKGSADKPPKHK